MRKKRTAIIHSELVSGYGFGKKLCFKGIYDGKDAFSEVKRFDSSPFSCHSAAWIPELRTKKGLSLCVPMLEFLSESVADLPEDVPVLIASTVGEIDLLHTQNRCTLNSLIETVKTLFRKRSVSLVSAACASSNVALDRAHRMICAGLCDTVIVAACDLVSEFVFSGFASIGAMTSETARPYDRNRSGLILGEAAGVLVLRSEETVKRQNILLRIAGSGMSGDAQHITAPQTDGVFLSRAIRDALEGIPEDEVGCVLGHGTGTVYNDIMELNAVRRIWSHGIPLASAKGGCGHTLGTCGLIQAILAEEVFQTETLFPQIGFVTPEDGSENMVSSGKQKTGGKYILSLNSGFGGINSAVLLEKSI